MSQKFQIANDYIFINALSKACGIKLPQDFEKALDLVFDEYKRFHVPDYYYLIPVKTRYPCVANFTDSKFKKTELYSLMESQPQNYFMLIDAFNAGADSIYFAFNEDFYEKIKNKLKNPEQTIITSKINDTVKQLIPASTLLI